MSRSSRTRTASTARKGHQQQAPPGLPEDCWDEPVVAVQPTDLEQLQGAWVSVSDRRQVEFLISGNRFTVHFARGSIYMGIFELNATTQPKTMTVHIEEGQPQHKGQSALCIYELNGEHFRWCTPGPGSVEQLSGFPPEHDSHYLHLVFRRELPKEDEATSRP